MPSDIILNDDDIDIVGSVRLKRDENGSETLLLDVQNGNLVLGGNDTDGDVILRDNDGNDRVVDAPG